MRDKIVNETLSFEEDADLYSVLKIGSKREYEIGDKFELLTTLYAQNYHTWTSNHLFKKFGHVIMHKGDIINIREFDYKYHRYPLVLVNIPNDYTSLKLDTLKEQKDWFKRL